MLTVLSETTSATNAWLRWPASMKIRRDTSPPSQGVEEDIEEDIELGTTPSRDTSANPSSNACTPANIGHVQWVSEDSIGQEAGSNLHQQQPAERFASQRDLSRFTTNHTCTRVPAADNRCLESHSASGPYGATGPSCESDEEAPGTLSGYSATPAVRKSSSILTVEVEGSLGRCPSVSSFRTDQHVEMLPWLSKQVTIGRNSNFHGLSAKDREELGGIEYRSLKILLKILIGTSVVSCYG